MIDPDRSKHALPYKQPRLVQDIQRCMFLLVANKFLKKIPGIMCCNAHFPMQNLLKMLSSTSSVTSSPSTSPREMMALRRSMVQKSMGKPCTSHMQAMAEHQNHIRRFRCQCGVASRPMIFWMCSAGDKLELDVQVHKQMHQCVQTHT